MSDCKVCGWREAREFLEICGAWLRKCTRCGVVYLDKAWSVAELKSLYSRQYFCEREQYFFPDRAVGARDGRPPEHIRDFGMVLDLLESDGPPGRMLDVGCGTGVFLSLAKTRGWDGEGVEISEYACQVGRNAGLQVHCGTLAEQQLPEASFDVVTMLDVLEHLTEPLRELEEVRRVLRPGGRLVVDSPNEEAWVRRMARWAWVLSGGVVRKPLDQIYHQYHLYHFTRRSLETLLDRARFRIDLLRCKPIPISKGRGRRAVRLLIRGLSYAEGLSGNGYEMLVVARNA